MVVLVAMIVLMTVVVAMFVMFMVVLVMAVVAIVPMIFMRGAATLLGVVVRRSSGIGSAFRIEGRLDIDQLRPESLQHVLDDVILPDAQAIRHDLRWQVPVADVPGQANQIAG